MPGGWEAFYKSDLQGAWAVSIVPLAFLGWRLATSRRSGGLAPELAPFLETWARAFALLTVVDPWVTGPLLRHLGLSDGPVATILLVVFVLLGDWRVFLLVFRVADRRASLRNVVRRATAWTLIVPAIAVPTTWALGRIVDDLHGMTIWIVYESAFTALALAVRSLATDGSSPATRPYVRAVLAYVATYYGLWALADAAIIFGGLDVGWLLRVVPNQLYYAWWVPFAWWRFFAPSYVATSTSTQVSR